MTLNVVAGFFIFAGVQSMEELPLGQALPATDSPLGQAAAHPQQVVTNTVVKQMTWETVEASSYLDYIDNLRRIGCPEETIRDIILADVNKLYKTKRREAIGQKKFEYWKSPTKFRVWMSKENIEATNELNAERDELLKQLGIESSLESEISQILNPLGQLLGFLPEQKQLAVLKEMQSIKTRVAELSEDGELDMVTMQQAGKDMRKSIKGMLSEEEYTNYLLRTSPTANQMRRQIAGFDPTEDEFLSVFKLNHAFSESYDAEYGVTPDENAEHRDQRNADREQLNEQIRQALGDERYADYERAQDYKFQADSPLAEKSRPRHRRGDSSVRHAKSRPRRRPCNCGETRALNDADRRERLLQIRNETESAIQQVVGTDGWEKFNLPTNTRWLQRIAPDEPPPVPTQQPNP